MISEHKNEYQFDGDGRPVVDKEGMRNYHMSEPPGTALTTSIRSYQVWSTVLGSSLTAIFANGNKAETKVFAGKAVIGRQGTVGIGWRTADPITGTLVKIFYTSEYGTSFIKEETEPLGQQIDLQDSEEQPDPTYEIRLGSADDPQWQCLIQQYFGGFQAMPWSCQFATKDEQSFTPKEENPINAHEAGHILPSTKQEDLPVDATTTEKPEAETQVGNVIPASFVPDSDTAGDGLVLGVVEVNGNFDSDTIDIPGYVDAGISSGGGGNSRRRDNKGRKARESDIRNNLDKCIKELFNARRAKLPNGGIGLNQYWGYFMGRIAGVVVSVSTNVDVDSETLGKYLKEHGVGDGSKNSGATLGNNPTKNYVASDVIFNDKVSAIGKWAVFIHELGNALAGQRYLNSLGTRSSEYGKDIKQIGDYGEYNKKYGVTSDQDAGTALEICVFGGIVGLKTGRVGNSRETW